jgi:hypothetical protein
MSIPANSGCRVGVVERVCTMDSWIGFGYPLSGTVALLSFPSSMSLLPRWRFMTDEAKALTRRTAISAGVVLLVLLLVRPLLPWVVLALVVWWIWGAVRR